MYIAALVVALLGPIVEDELAAPVPGQSLPDQRELLQGVDPCALARSIASMEPCLDPKNCRSREAWIRHFGRPRLRFAVPQGHPVGGSNRPLSTPVDMARLVCPAEEQPAE